MTSARTVAPSLPDALDRYLAAAVTGDRQQAVQVALDLLAAGDRPETIITDLLVAAQARIGEGWQLGTWTVAQEHRASAIAEYALQAVVDTAMRTPGAVPEGSAGQVIVACSEGEWHVLPGRMASEILRLRGCEVSFIGPSIPADVLVEMFDFDPPSAVAVTCSMPLSLVGAWSTISALRQLGVTVICGGRGFGIDGVWAPAVGADVWAATFEEGADALMAALHGPRVEPRDPVGSRDVTAEVQALRLEAPALVEQAMAVSLDSWPWLSESSYSVKATRLDLRTTMQAAQSCALVGDVTLIEDYVHWFESVLLARDLPVAYVASAMEVLAEVTPVKYRRVRAALVDGLDLCSQPPMVR